MSLSAAGRVQDVMRAMWVAVAALACQGAWAAEAVVCQVDYGGQTVEVRAAATASPQAVYDVSPTAIGSYFLFRIVFQRSPHAQASIKLYTYADRDEGPVLIHQARYPYPPMQRHGEGFTGRHWVYEPVRDGELQYTCSLVRGAAR